MTVIGVIVALIVAVAAAAAGYFIGYNNRKKTAEAQIGSAEAEATRLVNEAIKTADQKRKEAILEAALRKNPVFFWIGAGVALLTTFYMMRVIFVVFFGKSRSHSSEHASEVGGLMLVPLLILAVLALISGYGFIADRLVPFNGFVSESFHMGMPFYVSMGALVLGILLAAAFYAGSPASDKLSGNAVSRALANRLYIDLFYDKVLVRGVQGVLAAIIDFMDQFIISGLIVGGLARLTAAIGSLLRRLQSGNMAAYTALFGIGLLLVIYFIVFYSC